MLPIRYGTAVLADKNGYQRKILRTLLRSSGFHRVSEFDNIEAGLAEAERAQPDFMFVDYDTAQQTDLLRGKQDLAKTYLSSNSHLIILLQNPTRHRVDSAISSGASWVISRPYSPKILNRRLRAILDPSFVVALSGPNEPIKVETPLTRSQSIEQLSISDLTRQMDELLEKSSYFSGDQSDNATAPGAAPARKFHALKDKLQTGQAPLKKDDTEGVVLI